MEQYIGDHRYLTSMNSAPGHSNMIKDEKTNLIDHMDSIKVNNISRKVYPDIISEIKTQEDILRKMDEAKHTEFSKTEEIKTEMKKHFYDSMILKQKKLPEERIILLSVMAELMKSQKNNQHANYKPILVNIAKKAARLLFKMVLPITVSMVGDFFGMLYWNNKKDPSMQVVLDKLDKLDKEIIENDNAIRNYMQEITGQSLSQTSSENSDGVEEDCISNNNTIKKKHEYANEEYSPDYRRFCGYKFDENFILKNERGIKFEYNFYEQNILNQERYNMIGEAINQYIYELLLSKYKMHQHFIPFDASNSEPQGFFFASENAENTEDKLLILIHGSGVVRAGQWSRRIIINDNLMDGSQIPYIEQAYREGYEVVLLNTNQNKIENKYIRGSKSPEEHALYVWDNFIMNKVKAKHIAIMAHGYGGRVTLSMADRRYSPFVERVFAIGCSKPMDSFGYQTKQEIKDLSINQGNHSMTATHKLNTGQSSVRSWMNYVIDKSSQGNAEHQWTSAAYMRLLFKLFGDKLNERKRL